MQNSSNIMEHTRSGWAERHIMRRCQIGAPAARVVGELAGIRSAPRTTDDIVAAALARLAVLKQGASR